MRSHNAHEFVNYLQFPLVGFILEGEKRRSFIREKEIG